MGRSFGEQFKDTALGPIVQSDLCLRAGKLEEALAHLSREQLMGAVREGVEAVARIAGAPALSIFKQLPMAELDRLMDELDKARHSAVALASAANEPGALLGADAAGDEGITLRGVAASRPAGDPLAAPLTAVADGIDQWHLSVQQCCAQINGIGELGSAYRSRQMKRFAMLVPVAALLGLGGAWLARRHLANTEVSAALTSEDLCAVEQVDPDNLKRVAGPLAAKAETALGRCQEHREQQRQQQQEQRRLEQQRLEQQQRREQQQRACQRLSEHMKSNALDATDAKLAGSHIELLRRVAAGSVEPDDIGRDVSTLPCAGTAGGDELRRACATTLISSWNKWISSGTPSASVRELIAKAKPEMDEATRETLKRQVRQQADGALASGRAETIARSKALCELLVSTGIEQPRPCVAEPKR